MRNGLHYDHRTQRRSTSIPQTSTYPLSTSSKRPSSETVASSQLNSRRQSKNMINVHEL